jgi:hypothetical protein
MLDELVPCPPYGIFFCHQRILLEASGEVHPHQKPLLLAPNTDDTVCPYSRDALAYRQ